MTTKKYFIALGVAGLLSIVCGSVQVLALDSTGIDSRGSISITTQTSDETWQKSTWHRIKWDYTGINSNFKAKLYLKEIVQSGIPREYGFANVNLKKKTIIAPLKYLNKIPLGKYKIVIRYRDTVNSRVTDFSGDSVGVITLVKAPDPQINVTAPLLNTQWSNKKQRVTWVANFVRIQIDDKNANKYAGIRSVPTYGVGPSGKNLDLSKMNESDKKAVLSLGAKELSALSKLSDEQKDSAFGTFQEIDAYLNPDPLVRLINDPQIREAIERMLKSMSSDGIEQLKMLDLGSIKEFDSSGTLAKIQEIDHYVNPDPLMKTLSDPRLRDAIGDLFGNEDSDVPEKIPVIIEAVPVMSGSSGQLITTVPIKLAKSYLEKGRHIVNFAKIKQAGKYKIKISTNLPKNVIDKHLGGRQIVAESPIFEVKLDYVIKPKNNNNNLNRLQ